MRLSTAEDTSVSVTLTAHDAEGAPLAFVVGSPGHGTIAGSAPIVTYTPAPDYHGPDAFTVQVFDGLLTADALVRIEVTSVNDAPMAVDDARAATEDLAQDLDTVTLVANDLDVDGDALTVTAVDDAQHCTATLVGGSIHVVPEANFIGDASFAYVVSDGTADGHGRVVLAVGAVNDPPVAVDDVATTDEDTALDLAAAALTANDTDPDSQALQVTAVAAGAGGTVSLSAGVITFTPDANVNGPATFTYTISDGVATDTGVVTVTVVPVNDAPVAIDDVASANEDTALVIDASALTANDTDVDQQPLTITAVSDAVGGSVALVGTAITFTPTADQSGTAAFRYTVSDGAASATGVVTVTIAAVNDAPVAVDDVATTAEDVALDLAASALTANDTDPDGPSATVTQVGNATGGTVTLGGGTVHFTPTRDFAGTASFEYTVSDGLASDVGTVVVTVTPINDAPVAVDDTAATDEDVELVVPVATLLANDTDVDGTPIVVAVGGASAGTVTLAAGLVTYHPVADAHGTATFDYTISDGLATAVATVTVTIASVNDTPTAVDDAATMVLGTELIVPAATLLANDTDVDGDVLTIAAVGGATTGTVAVSGGVVTFAPAPGVSGPASFTYDAQDPSGASATATVHVTIKGICGDGLVSVGEGCDDGNTTDGDGCTAACVVERCGDAITNDAHVRPPTAIAFTWLATSCGGPATMTFTIAGQPALVTEGDSGTCTCTPGVRTATVTDPAVLALLADGSNQVGVAFPGAGNSLLAWAVATVTAGGTTQDLVIFDQAAGGDAEARRDDLCAAGYLDGVDVTTAGIVTLIAGEQCDDGDDTDPLDGCDACVLARCGDAIVQHTEVCDDGNAVGGDGCRADCHGVEACGDGLVDAAAGEQCDDANDADPLDGCNACLLPQCGDGARQATEACDDGNTAYGDGCRGDCAGLEVCGDGQVDFGAGEQCDDGDDTNPADGCDACQLGVIADVAPQVVSGALSCDTTASNTGRKIASDGLAEFYVVMRCGGAAWVNASTDRGQTWGAPVATGLTGVSEVAIEGGGPVGVVYVAAVAGGRLMFTRSVDAGATWDTAQDLGAASDAEVSIDALGDSIYVAISAGGGVIVYRNPDLGAPAGWASVAVTQSNVFHDVLVDKISGAVVAASDDPSFHIRISTDGGATCAAEAAPPGLAYYSDWTASNGVLYAVGTSGGSNLATVIPLSAPATSTTVSGLPVVNASQTRAIDADPLGNAYVVSQLDSGVVQLDRIKVGASAVDAADVRTFGSGAYPGVAALPSSTGAVLVFGSGGQVWAAVEGY
ncbi:MAG: tandem-95 repeat protein [Deltaproteobacteria bacterium]|nr:tandem-95 repeat protein [Deltaproteobacteria bacterium]